MPAVVGAIKIINVGPASTVQIGDAVLIAPQSVSKTFAGAGSFNTGDYLRTFNTVSATNTYDMDTVDTSLIPLGPIGGIG